ncbi:type VII secretion-associated serine protease mycosin [Streptomyces sp. YIM 98790]|uniref:type VII secretion-associated serine protease mycosin n=1 Tax=Streptomyces sp. YIM 98790 TaxID=2689077 RepID=UPI001408E97D|nr:type VII secretion-associated serine protease mycosin [Streptomyces sp. YIM 98790]
MRSRPGRHRLTALLAPLLGTALALGLPPGTAAPARADTIRDQQRWALDAINAPAAWETTRGAGVTVAVLDTGVDAGHPDLAGAVLQGKDFVSHGAEPGDEHWAGHGTAMAGIIAGRGHGADSGSGIVGVAPEADILPVRVLLEENDPARDEERDAPGNAVADGIRWAVDQGADVINLSLGDDSPSAHPDAEEDAAIRHALAEGVVVVASAGNGGESGDPVSYPAGYPGVIAVTAVDRSGARAPFSTRRWYATVSAPGKDVIIAAPGSRYMQGWGTSAAAAFVSGSVALLRSAYPELSPAQIKRLLAETAQDPPEGGRDDRLGGGLVDPAAAIEAAAGLAPEPPVPAAGPYPQRYFGAGPDPAGSAGRSTPWLAPLAGALGVLLLGGAVVLFRRTRPH